MSTRLRWLLLTALVACGGDDGTDEAMTAADTGSMSGSSGGDTAGESGDSGAVDSSDGGDAEPPDGAQLFAGFCAPCHGNEGQGTDLAYEIQHPPVEYATWVIRNGRPGVEFPDSMMAAWAEATLSDADVAAILEHLDGFPQPTTGEALYADYCANCHGADAQGGVVGISPLDEIIDGDYDKVVDQVRDGDAEGGPGARSNYMPAFGTDALTNAEVDLIVDFLIVVAG